MKKEKQAEVADHLLQEIKQILTTTITDDERTSLLYAQHGLEKQQYFPRIVSDLQRKLTPLAVSRRMSESVKPLYLDLIKFSDKGFGRGLSVIWGNAF